MNWTDEDIIEKIKDKKTVDYGFNLLMEKYQEKVYWVIRRMVIDHESSDDIAQETFVKVWKNLDKFKGESKLYTWIYRIATNEALTHLRKKKRRFFLPIGDVENELRSTLEADTYYGGDEIQLKLQKAILTLPEKQRLVFNMKYFEELKFREIAEVLEVTVGSLKAQYHHAVKKIEKYLKED
ncbi:sigma-70 family RNA polymerase sigma factor [Flavobacteriales bacterium]|nr:sigma-70 family RNA polymerase sigma factor [Flavobacteriales bacterium]